MVDQGFLVGARDGTGRGGVFVTCAVVWAGEWLEVLLASGAGLVILSIVGAIAGRITYSAFYGKASDLLSASPDVADFFFVVLYVWFYPLVVMLTPIWAGFGGIVERRNPAVTGVSVAFWAMVSILAVTATIVPLS